jgi:multifunctional methyltransferase subunit TRM112
MKVITANFVTCAVKECKTSAASFPLHFHDAELEQQELDFQPEFIRNVLPRVDWDSLRITANEVGHDMASPRHTTHYFPSPQRKRSFRSNES